MSTEWDSELQRLNSGEVPHAASAELLHWQVSALVEDGPQQIDSGYMFESYAGNVYLNRQLINDDPGNITHTIEVFTAAGEERGAVSFMLIEFTPQHASTNQFNTGIVNPVATINSIIDGIKEENSLTSKEESLIDSLRKCVDAILREEEADLPEELIVDLSRTIGNIISKRADVHIISSEFSTYNDEVEFQAKLRRYVDVSFEKPELSEGEGEFEVLITDIESRVSKTLCGGADQEVYVMDPFDVVTGLGEYRPAATTDENDVAKLLAALLRPSLPDRSPDWLSQYSGYLGWSIHRQGSESSYAVEMGVELDYVRSLFVSQLEAINHFIPEYAKDHSVADIELLFADNNCHPNGFALQTEELVDFIDASLQKLDATKSHTAIYLGTRFFEPGAVVEGIEQSYGAYLDVMVALPSNKPGKIKKCVGSVALNATEMIESDRTAN